MDIITDTAVISHRRVQRQTWRVFISAHTDTALPPAASELTVSVKRVSVKRLQTPQTLQPATSTAPICFNYHEATIETFSCKRFQHFVVLQFGSFQFKMVSIRSEKAICAPPRLSEVPPRLPLKRFQCSSNDDGPLSSFQGRSSGASSFHTNPSWHNAWYASWLNDQATLRTRQIMRNTKAAAATRRCTKFVSL